MGNADVLWKALFWIRTARSSLEISKTKDILEENKSRETQTIFFFPSMKWNSWLFPALEDFLRAFLLWGISYEVLKVSGTLQNWEGQSPK